MKNHSNLLLEGMERLGVIASRIRKNGESVPRIEIDIILQELRNLYMEALLIDNENPQPETAEADTSAEEQHKAEEAEARRLEEERRKAAEAEARRLEEERRKAAEAEARRAVEEKRKAEEAEARRAAEEKRKAEEAEARRAAEEKRKAAEAEARRVAEEKRKAAEAEARRAAEEEAKPIFAPDENAGIDPDHAAAQVLQSIDDHSNDELFAPQPQPAANTARLPRQESSLFDYLSKEHGEESHTILADTLNKKTTTAEERLEHRVNAHKVDDLRTIININDKFSFMSELFRNNMKAYNDFILKLNSLTDREEALKYVAEIARLYMWNDASQVVKSFYKVFDRKF